MATPEIEEVVQEVQLAIQQCTEEQVLIVGELLNLPEVRKAKLDGKGLPSLLRLVNRYLYSEAFDEQTEDNRLLLNTLRVKLDSFRLQTEVPVEGSPASSTEVSHLPPVEGTNHRIPSTVGNIPWKREFKISGQIGEPGQKDRLNFASLARQIESGSRKGFSTDEIIDGVLRAVVPGSRLRNYLEGRADITLPELRRILRAHFQEKEATTVFHELSTAVQGPKETAHSFVLRAMDLRQKVVFASQEAGTGVVYGPKQVQQMFLNTLFTGLQSEYVRQQMQPLLRNPTTTDEELLESLSLCVGQEAERYHKMRKLKINQVTLPTEEEATPPRRTDKNKPTERDTNPVSLEDIQAGVREIIRAEISALQQVPPREKSQRPTREWGCKRCVDRGKGRECTHCFKCGSDDHFQRGCKQGRNLGNGRRPPERDIE